MMLSSLCNLQEWVLYIPEDTETGVWIPWGILWRSKGLGAKALGNVFRFALNIIHILFCVLCAIHCPQSRMAHSESYPMIWFTDNIHYLIIFLVKDSTSSLDTFVEEFLVLVWVLLKWDIDIFKEWLLLQQVYIGRRKQGWSEKEKS